MYRAPFRLPRRALLAASVATTGVVLLDSPSEKKLSIYSSPTPEILLLETPSPLEQQIGVLRRQATQAYRDAHSQVQGVVSKWIGVEHAVEHRVKAIISPNESLTPGLLYVGIATLTGSILARNRMLATRLLLPPTFLMLSLNHFLPQTSHNLTSYFASLEETYFPTFAQKHDVANAHSRMAWEQIKDASKGSREWLNRGADVAVDKVQDLTGLKLKETLGWAEAREAVQKVEHKVVDAAKAVEKVVEEKVDEAKELLSKKVEKTNDVAEKKAEDVKLV